MIRRIFDALRRRGAVEPAHQIRPNELRRDVVQAERRRREATSAATSARRAPPLSEEERVPRKPPPALREPQPVSPHAIGAVLKSRSGLRAAWLAKEVLGPPPSLRGMRDDDVVP